MIVTAALNWWNEPTASLAAAVGSVASVADRIVALDGAYSRYPGATVRSDPEQGETITRVAQQHGLTSLVVTADRLWEGQLEKRTRLMQLAAEGSDWIVILDADYEVTADRRNVRAQLEQGSFDVYDVPMTTPRGEYATSWHRQQAETAESWTPLVMRALPDIRVERHHWWYSGLRDGQRVWLWGDTDEYPRLPHGRLTDFLITHTTALRDHDQVMAARSWYNDVVRVSQMSGQEDDRPDLPRPVLDTESMW